jgi:hypothetical protein
MQRMLPRYVGLTFALLALVTSASADNDANDDINLDFSVISGLTGGPTSYLDGIKEMPWELSVFLNKCELDEGKLKASAKSAFTQSKLAFVDEVPAEHILAVQHSKSSLLPSQQSLDAPLQLSHE